MSYIEFQTNSRYIQCENALSEIRRYTHGMGENYLIVTGCGAITKSVEETVRESFESGMESKCNPELIKTNFKYAANIDRAREYDAQNIEFKYSFVNVEGNQCSLSNIKKLVSIAGDRNADVIIGIGGGKCLDLVRGVSYFRPVRVVLCPTSHASNASGSGITMVYNDEGVVVDKWFMPVLPELVIADLSVLLKAPYHMLSAGIGDGIACNRESLALFQAMGLREAIPDNAWYTSEAIIRALLENGRDAVKAAREKVLNHAFISVLPCILNACGSIRSFRSDFIPHLMDEVLLQFEGSNGVMHGHRVGYAVIPEMVYESAPLPEIHDYIDFCLDIGIPVDFAGLNIPDISYEELYKAAEIMLEGNTAKSVPLKLKPEDFANCAIQANQIVSGYLGRFS